MVHLPYICANILSLKSIDMDPAILFIVLDQYLEIRVEFTEPSNILFQDMEA